MSSIEDTPMDRQATENGRNTPLRDIRTISTRSNVNLERLPW